MNKFLIAGIVSLSLTACKKSETKVETTENPDGTVTTTTIETEKTTALDSATVNATVEHAREKLNKAGEKIDEVADKAGDELQKAGSDVKDAAVKGAEKVESGAEKVKEDLKKK